MNDHLKKYSVTIAGHRTSLSLEPEFWECLCALAREQGIATAALLREIDAARGTRPLSGAVRLYVLHHLRNQAGRSQVAHNRSAQQSPCLSEQAPADDRRKK